MQICSTVFVVLQHWSMLGQCLVRYCYGFLQLPLCNTSNELKNKVWKRSFPHIFKLNDAFANWVLWYWVLRPVRFQRHESAVFWSVTSLLTYRECAACSILTAGCSVLTSHCSIVTLMLNHLLSGAAGGHSFCRPGKLQLMLVSELRPRKIKCSQLPAVQTKYNTERCTFWLFERWLLLKLSSQSLNVIYWISHHKITTKTWINSAYSSTATLNIWTPAGHCH